MTTYTKREQELMSQAFEEGLKMGHDHAETYWRFKIAQDQNNISNIVTKISINHDELLAKMDYSTEKELPLIKFYSALRAVVKLSKITSGFEYNDAFESGWDYAMDKVIRVIEKELNE